MSRAEIIKAIRERIVRHNQQAADFQMQKRYTLEMTERGKATECEVILDLFKERGRQ